MAIQNALTVNVGNYFNVSAFAKLKNYSEIHSGIYRYKKIGKLFQGKFTGIARLQKAQKCHN